MATTYPESEISSALNYACDEIIELLGEDEAATDALNLLVNAALHRLEHPADSLEDVVEACFGDPDDNPLNRLRDRG